MSTVSEEVPAIATTVETLLIKNVQYGYPGSVQFGGYLYERADVSIEIPLRTWEFLGEPRKIRVQIEPEGAA